MAASLTRPAASCIPICMIPDTSQSLGSGRFLIVGSLKAILMLFRPLAVHEEWAPNDTNDPIKE